MHKGRVIVAALGIMAASFAGSVGAVALVLEQAPPQTLGPQSESAPCIIAGTTCQNPPSFPYTDFTQAGNIDAYAEFSPTYSVSQFPFLTFDVAIDVNTSNDAGETLNQFLVFIDMDGEAGPMDFFEAYTYTGPTAIGDVSNNGNGFGDWALRTVDLSSYAPDALVRFFADWSGNTGGAESFFLVPAGGEEPPPPPTGVPEPGALGLLVLGLLGLRLPHKLRALRKGG